MKITKNLLVSEMFASIANMDIIAHFFEMGLKINNDRLAVSAMEELIRRDEVNVVVQKLNEAFENGLIVPESSLVALIGNALAFDGHCSLCEYGDCLLRGEYLSPQEWIHKNEHLEEAFVERREGITSNTDEWLERMPAYTPEFADFD